MSASQSGVSKTVRSTAEQPTQESIRPLVAVSSSKSVSSGGNPKGVTSLSVEMIDSGKAKTTTRKTPSPSKSPALSPVPPPPKYTSRKTPSPGKTGSPKGQQQQTPLKVDVELAAKGRKTPSPNVSRKTPSPNVRKTPTPNTSASSRKTPSPNVRGRNTPSPNVSGRKNSQPKCD